jgi:hypothetical protein
MRAFEMEVFGWDVFADSSETLDFEGRRIFG